MFTHKDLFSSFNDDGSLKQKLVRLHQILQAEMPFVARLAIALYDPKTEKLATYLHSSGADNPLPNYEADLEQAPSLQEIIRRGTPRIVNDISVFAAGEHEHTQKISQAGYASSYTRPMYYHGLLFGFQFFNAHETDVFTESGLHKLDIYGQIITLLLINDLAVVDMLSAAVKTTQDIAHFRDPETGNHLDRMSHYSRLIASELAHKYQLDDLFINRIFIFSPLHDIGKIAISDNILLKAGPLDDAEYAAMKLHTVKGREMIDDLIDNFELNEIKDISILRNIAEFHHEKVNGSGYPSGLKGDEIPLEARIVAVADVFDALTSQRTYKRAWTNEDAFAFLTQCAGEQFDRACVQALIEHEPDVRLIQTRFKEDFYS